MAQENIGKWSAEVDNSGKAPFLIVNGDFPVKDGEKPKFHLRKNEPQGINPTELLLTLVFGYLADSSSKINAFVIYSEIITSNDYKTVLIIDDNERKIASINVSILKE